MSKALNHTTIYALGNIIGNIVSIVMLPIYTRYLTPADYGIAELLSMTLDIVSILIGMRIGQAMFRYYTHAKTPAEANHVISTALWISGILNTIAFIALFVFSSQITTLVFDDTAHENLLILFSITIICSAFIEVPKIYLRASERPWMFFFFGLFKLVLQVALNIYFVVYLDLHVAGVVYSALIASIVMSIIFTAYTIYHTKFHFSFPMAKLLINFSLPLLLTTLGSFIMTYGDRFFLQKFYDVGEVGIYALAYKFGFILMILTWTPFSQAWDGIRYEIYKRDNATESYQRIFMYVTLGIVTVATGIAVYVKPVIQIMADPAFHFASEVAPIILIAYLLFAWTNYCNFGIFLKEKTRLMAYAEGIAVVFIIALYALLIPFFGAIGAAWATVLGFGIRLIATEVYANKLYHMHLPWLRAGLLVVTSGIIYALTYLSPEALIASIAYRSFLVLIFFAAVYILPILNKNEKEEILETITGTLKKLPLFNRASSH